MFKLFSFSLILIRMLAGFKFIIELDNLFKFVFNLLISYLN